MESMSKKQIVGLVGSFFLFVGVFLPLVHVPFVGGLNYLRRDEGKIIIVFTVISIILILKKKYKGLWLTGFGSLGLILFTFSSFQSMISDMKSDMLRESAGNPFVGLAAEAIAAAVPLGWGWAVLFAGAALVILAAAMRQDTYIVGNDVIRAGKQILKHFAEKNNFIDDQFSSTNRPVLDTSNWYYAKDGQPCGPFQYNVVREFIKGGLITTKTLVWNDGPGAAERGWIRAAGTELSALFKDKEQL
ncbi:MAG: DUF4339 domain-containing protein [Synergistaceae bacterium]|jgi:hypothetical protein|nr:DUF4339 domain-containing protein [Synergistaceae bacterium]